MEYVRTTVACYRLFPMVLAILLATCPANAHGSSADEEMKQRFLDDAPRAWLAAEKSLTNLDMELAIEIRNRASGEEYAFRRLIRAKIRDNMVLQEIDECDSNGTLEKSKVDAVNDRGSFTLRREGITPWVVGFAGTGPDRIVVRATEKRGRAYVSWPWRVGGTYLPELCGASEFHLIRVDAIELDGRAMAMITFTFDAPDERVRTRDGSIVLDPEAAWSVKRCDVQLESANDAARLVVENEYVAGSDVVPVRSTMKIIHENANSEHALQFKKYARKLVPEAEFQMAAYGIDMEIGQTPSSNRRRVLLVSASVLLLVAALLLHRRYRAAAAGHGKSSATPS